MSDVADRRTWPTWLVIALDMLECPALIKHSSPAQRARARQLLRSLEVDALPVPDVTYSRPAISIAFREPTRVLVIAFWRNADLTASQTLLDPETGIALPEPARVVRLPRSGYVTAARDLAAWVLQREECRGR